MHYTKFKSLRIRKRISQEELSKRSGVNIRTIQALECGARSTHRMTLENAYRLALALDISVTSFLERDHIVFPDGRTGVDFEEDLKDLKASEAEIKKKATEQRRQNAVT